MTPRLTRAAIACAARIVPRDERHRWRQEWLAELAHGWSRQRHPSFASRWNLTARVWAAAIHAIWLRKERLRVGNLLQDVRFALRLAARERAFTVTAVLTLSLGIGVTTAIFSVVNRTLLRPLAFERPEELVAIWESIPSINIPRNSPKPSTYELWQREARSLTAIAAYTSTSLNLSGDGEPERLIGLRASVPLLPTLGVRPMIGRNFTADDERTGAPGVVLLTHALWARRYNRDPSVLGRTVTLNARPSTIIGVLPADLPMSLRQAEAWVPLVIEPERRNWSMLWIVGRLRAGVSHAAVRAELEALAHRPGDGGFSAEIGVAVVPMDEQLRGGVRPDLLLLFGVSGVVLLIACSNVATMMLARGLSRQRELALRTALGATRARLVRMAVAESAVLGAAGAAIGWLLAIWALRVIGAIMPETLARVVSSAVDARMLLVACGLALATTLACGVLPMLAAARTTAGIDMRSGGERPMVRSLRSALVLVEVALAVVLLVSASVLIRTFAQIVLTPTGFIADRALTANIDRTEPDAAKRTQFYQALERDLSGRPGVLRVGLINGLPLQWTGGGSGFRLEGGAAVPRFVRGHHRIINGSYFDAMGITRLRGETFTGAEQPDDELVAVVSQSFAADAWPNADPLGQRFQWGNSGPWIRVIGVVTDVRLTKTSAPRPHAYFPYTQVPNPAYVPASVVLRTDGDPEARTPMLRDTVRRLDASQPIADVMTLQQLVDRSVGSRRFTLALMATFAGLALILVAVGIYGVLSYLVGRRTREIGIRVAIGATRSQIRAGVLRQGLTLSVAGIALGIAAVVALSRWGAAMVPGLAAPAVAPAGAAVAVLLGVSAIACYVPARRAMNVSPLVALKND